MIHKRKKAIIIFGIVLAAVFIICIIWIFTSFQKQQIEYKRTTNSLSRMLDDMVEESYMFYGNPTYSQYKDIISISDYDRLYYLDNGSGEKPDRSQLEILISYHSYPETEMKDSKHATSTFTAKAKYIIKGTPLYRNGYPYYEKTDMYLGVPHYTVEWEYQDGKWRVTDVSYPVP